MPFSFHPQTLGLQFHHKAVTNRQVCPTTALMISSHCLITTLGENNQFLGQQFS
nr:MAG TPA: hypothetical protein [Caudoviricetes sp.]